MIKPRSSPSHFELQAEAQQRNLKEKLTHILVKPQPVEWTVNVACCTMVECDQTSNN